MLAYRFHNNSPKNLFLQNKMFHSFSYGFRIRMYVHPSNLFEICSKITQQRLMSLHLQGKSASRRTHLLGCKPQITKK